MNSTPSTQRDGTEPRPRPPFLNVKEAAAALRLDESTLYRHLREDRFPGLKLGGRYLIPTAVIDELVAGAMDAGHCIDIQEWTTRWRERNAAALLAAVNTHGRVTR